MKAERAKQRESGIDDDDDDGGGDDNDDDDDDGDGNGDGDEDDDDDDDDNDIFYHLRMCRSSVVRENHTASFFRSLKAASLQH